MNEFGRIQHFYEVFRFRWNDRAGCWDKRPGNDSEKVIAFPVQSNAHDMIQGKLFDIGLERCTEWGFMNCVHDSLEFMPRDEDVEECIETTANIMIQPCPQLVAPACPMGLSVGVDVSVGKNWMSWDEEKNPEGMKEIRSYPAIWEMPKAGRGDL